MSEDIGTGAAVPFNEPSFLRHSGWFAPELVTSTTLNIIGVGATGSHIGLLAARMGFSKFRIWDADIVESHNLPNQIYAAEDIGKFKVDGFERVLKQFNPRVEVEKHNCFFETATHKDTLRGPCFMTVDTMFARKDIVEAIKLNFDVPYTIETRLGFDFGEVNCLAATNLSGIKQFEGTLRSDDEIAEGPCNLRICTTLVTLIASHAVHMACSYHVGQSKGEVFEFPPRTVIELSKQLQVYAF